MTWVRTYRADPRAAALADRHYSRQTPGSPQFAPPGRLLVLITEDGDAVWTSWSTNYPDAEWMRHAWCNTIFRNEAPDRYLSSDLITAAVAATVAHWASPPAGGTVTTVDPGKTRRKRDPGRCFRRAGFVELSERTKDRGLVVLRLAPEDHPLPVPAVHHQMRIGEAA